MERMPGGRRVAIIATCAAVALTAYMIHNREEPYREPSPYEFGVTIDRTDALDATVEVLQALPQPVTTRIVYDEFQPAARYRTATERIAAVSTVMGELLDSLYVKEYDTEAYAARTQEYVETLGEHVSIWEIGNEVNGEWLLNPGEHPGVVADKIQAAFNIVEQHRGQTALTLHYNERCYERGEHEIFTWIDEYLPRDVQQGLDYVLLSYYKENCGGRTPRWQPVFERLHTMFPNAKLGFGEIGVLEGGQAEKIERINRYYGYGIDVDGYIGGVFWWYFWDDVVQPYTEGNTTMLEVFQNVRE